MQIALWRKDHFDWHANWYLGKKSTQCVFFSGKIKSAIEKKYKGIGNEHLFLFL